MNNILRILRKLVIENNKQSKLLLTISYSSIFLILVYAYFDFQIESIKSVFSLDGLLVIVFLIGIPLVISILIALFFEKKSYFLPSLRVINLLIIIFSLNYILKTEIRSWYRENYFTEDRNSSWYYNRNGGIDSIKYSAIKYIENKTGKTVDYKPVFMNEIELDSVFEEGSVLVNQIYYLGEEDSSNMYSISLIVDKRYNVSEVQFSKAYEDSLLHLKYGDFIPMLELIMKLKEQKH